MKVIADDEEESSIILGGGKVTPEQKAEYMVSYYGIIDARKAGDKEKEKEYADKLINFLYAFVIKEIEDFSDNEKESAVLKDQGYSDEKIPSMLFTPEEIDAMNQDVAKIWETIDPEETDHIFKVNLVSLQCSFLFTKHAKNRKEPGVTKNYYHGILPPIRDNFYTEYKTLRDNLETVVNKEFITGYTAKQNQLEIYYLINVLPYISITDMIEAWFMKGIWIVGFSTRFQYTDGNNWISPFNFLTHDYGHADNTFYCYDIVFGEMRRERTTENRIRTYNLIREFYEYIKTKYDSDKPKLYSIKLLFFTSFHEIGHSCLSYFSNASDKERFKLSLWLTQQHTLTSRFSDENDLFLSLPTRIQGKAKDSSTNIINKEEIKKYFLEECIPNFTTALYDFQKIKGIITGGKKTKKRKIKRNKKKRRTRK